MFCEQPHEPTRTWVFQSLPTEMCPILWAKNLARSSLLFDIVYSVSILFPYLIKWVCNNTEKQDRYTF